MYVMVVSLRALRYASVETNANKRDCYTDYLRVRLHITLFFQRDEMLYVLSVLAQFLNCNED